MNGLLIGFAVGGVALVGGVIWAVVDNLFVYKRKPQTDDDQASDEGQTTTPSDP
jgi:hypothetical protein